MSETNPFPNWNAEKTRESLDAIYSWAVQSALSSIEWYDKKKRPQKLWSKTLRFLAIIFAAFGALCPLLDAAGIFASFNPSGAGSLELFWLNGDMSFWR